MYIHIHTYIHIHIHNYIHTCTYYTVWMLRRQRAAFWGSHLGAQEVKAPGACVYICVYIYIYIYIYIYVYMYVYIYIYIERER